jgi:hypothetical protein
MSWIFESDESVPNLTVDLPTGTVYFERNRANVLFEDQARELLALEGAAYKLVSGPEIEDTEEARRVASQESEGRAHQAEAEHDEEAMKRNIKAYQTAAYTPQDGDEVVRKRREALGEEGEEQYERERRESMIQHRIDHGEEVDDLVEERKADDAKLRERAIERDDRTKGAKAHDERVAERRRQAEQKEKASAKK